MKKLITIILIIAIVSVGLILGCAKEEKEIKIGVITPLTGGSAKYGEDIKRGHDLAVEGINEKGGINGSKIRLIYEDSEGVPEKAVSVAQKLIARDNVKIILGPLWSSPTMAVAPIAERNKVILFSSGSSAPEVTDAGEYVFRNELSDQYGAEQTARLFFRLGFEKIGILYINNVFGVGQKDVTEKVYNELGGVVTAAERFDQDAADFRAQLLKIKNKKPEGIFVVGYKEMILILKQIKELGIKTQILSVALFEDQDIIDQVGDQAEGAIYTYYGDFNPSSVEPGIKQFIEKFQDRYDTAPGYYAPIGYDAVNILAAAIQKAGMDTDKIKQVLYETRNFPGISGFTSFDNNGDVTKPVTLKTVKNGKFVHFHGEQK